LSNATHLTRPRSFYACLRVRNHHDWLHYSPPLKSTCVGQVASNGWSPPTQNRSLTPSGAAYTGILCPGQLRSDRLQDRCQDGRITGSAVLGQARLARSFAAVGKKHALREAVPKTSRSPHLSQARLLERARGGRRAVLAAPQLVCSRSVALGSAPVSSCLRLRCHVLLLIAPYLYHISIHIHIRIVYIPIIIYLYYSKLQPSCLLCCVCASKIYGAACHFQGGRPHAIACSRPFQKA